MNTILLQTAHRLAILATFSAALVWGIVIRNMSSPDAELLSKNRSILGVSFAIGLIVLVLGALGMTFSERHSPRAREAFGIILYSGWILTFALPLLLLLKYKLQIQ